MHVAEMFLVAWVWKPKVKKAQVMMRKLKKRKKLKTKKMMGQRES